MSSVLDSQFSTLNSTDPQLSRDRKYEGGGRGALVMLAEGGGGYRVLMPLNSTDNP